VLSPAFGPKILEQANLIPARKRIADRVGPALPLDFSLTEHRPARTLFVPDSQEEGGARMAELQRKAILPRDHRARVLMSALMIASLAGFPASAEMTANQAATHQDLEQIKSAAQQGRPVPIEAVRNPMARVSAKMTNVVVADTKAFGDEYRAAGVDALIDFDRLTPTSPILDHCDRISALTARADAMSKRFPDYVALLRKEAQAEADARHLTPQEVVDFVAGFSEGRPAFERRWTMIGRVTHDVGALCTVLARRHWQTGSTGELEMQDPTDAAEVGRLGLILQDEMTQLAEIEKTSKAGAEQEARKLEARAR
jgi:hypothetical protein